MGRWKDTRDSRYWKDPEYRARKLRQAREFRERHANDPIYQRIRYLESAVSDKRESIRLHEAAINTSVAKHQRAIAAHQDEFQRIWRELVKLRKQWHEKRAGTS